MNLMLVDFSRIAPNTTFIVHGVMLSTWSMWINSKCKGNTYLMLNPQILKLRLLIFFEKTKHFDKMYRLLASSTLILTVVTGGFWSK
jgi:hypothetical protein